jgi:hypothetical protein
VAIEAMVGEAVGQHVLGPAAFQRVPDEQEVEQQHGEYQELVNLMRLADNLKSSYQKKVTVQVKILNGVKYYTLILGQFPNRTKAEGFKEELRKKFPDAFIVEYGKL